MDHQIQIECHALIPNHLENYGRLSLSQEGVGLPADFPLCRFCFFDKMAIRSIYPPFVQIPMYL